MQLEFLADYPECIQELARLHFAEWSHFHPEESLDERIVRLQNSCGRRAIPSVVVALTDAKEVLGSASLVTNDMETRLDLTPWLAGVFVKQEHRRQGIGSALVDRIEGDARSLGVPKLFLYTPSAASLYERLGWMEVEHCDYKGTDVVIMCKDLMT